jgi:hypothetical protein
MVQRDVNILDIKVQIGVKTLFRKEKYFNAFPLKTVLY